MSDFIVNLTKLFITEQKKIKSSNEPVKKESEDEVVPYIHFKHIEVAKKKVQKEETEEDGITTDDVPELEWRNKNDNSHLGKTSQAISSQLKKTAPKLGDRKSDVTDYTGKTGQGSQELNYSLLNKRKAMHWQVFRFAQSLHTATSTPIGHNINLYSGVPTDPRRWEKDSTGATRLRAFTSMTHDKQVAHGFAHQWTKGENPSASGMKGNVHIIHLHVKPTDNALHVSHHSDYDEHETILPADTYIRPHPDFKKPEVHTASDGTKVHIHHYVVDRQQEAGQYKPENNIW